MSEQHKGAGRREEIEEANGEKRYIRRDSEGHFTSDQVDVGRSLSQDRRRHAEHEAPPGQGDRGDRKE
jgi:hypothetical protein